MEVKLPSKVKIGICFAVLNNFDGFAATIHSIKTRHDYRLYVVDQWRHNRPLSQAWNNAAMQAFKEGCDYALVCNDDILFGPKCIDKMVEEYERLRPTGCLMVSGNNIMLELANPEDILTYELPEDTPPSESDHPNFSCFMIKREYFEEVGFFDENFIPAWYEDNDSHRRAKLLGFRETCSNVASMVHFGGVATSRMENPSSEQSRQYYVSKWGGIPYPESETYQTPYNDPAFKPNMWKHQDGTVVGPLTKEVQQ